MEALQAAQRPTAPAPHLRNQGWCLMSSTEKRCGEAAGRRGQRWRRHLHAEGRPAGQAISRLRHAAATFLGPQVLPAGRPCAFLPASSVRQRPPGPTHRGVVRVQHVAYEVLALCRHFAVAGEGELAARHAAQHLRREAAPVSEVARGVNATTLEIGCLCLDWMATSAHRHWDCNPRVHHQWMEAFLRLGASKCMCAVAAQDACID